MTDDVLERTGSAVASRGAGSEATGRVLVAVDSDRHPDGLIRWALAIAPPLHRGVRLIERVSAAPAIPSVAAPAYAPGTAPVDPVEHDLGRRVLDARLAGIAAAYREGDTRLSRRVYEHLDEATIGEPGDAPPILALRRHDGKLPWLADAETRRFVERCCEAVLVVPARCEQGGPAALRRVLVPLDGSPRAERALPVAAAIARYHRAELVLLHAICGTALLAPEPLDPASLELAARVQARNTRVADAYLARLKDERAESELKLSTRVLLGEDPRHRLLDAIGDARAELLVLASHGESGHVDVATGSVAHFVLEHAAAPVLMVSSQPATVPSASTDRTSGAHLRRPGESLDAS